MPDRPTPERRPDDDLLTGPSWSVPGEQRWQKAWARLSDGDGLVGRLIRGARRRVVRQLVAAIGLAVVIAAVLAYQATRPDAVTHTDLDAVLTSAPVVISACPADQNCLTTSEVRADLLESVRAEFAGFALGNVASLFDAAIPEVDIQQVVGRLPDGTMLVLTQNRYSRGPATRERLVKTAVAGGVIIARQRGNWVLTVVLTSGPGKKPTPESIEAARRWTSAAPIPP